MLDTSHLSDYSERELVSRIAEWDRRIAESERLINHYANRADHYCNLYRMQLSCRLAMESELANRHNGNDNNLLS